MTVFATKIAASHPNVRRPIAHAFTPGAAPLSVGWSPVRLDRHPARKRRPAGRQPPALPALMHARANP